MTYLEALSEAVRRAKQTGQLCYVREQAGEYVIARNWTRDWLFQAYPGGRRILSAAGRDLAKEKLLLDKITTRS